MRALPQIDIQPAPIQADAPTRATGRDGGNFAAYKKAFSKLDVRVGHEKPRRSLAIANV